MPTSGEETSGHEKPQGELSGPESHEDPRLSIDELRALRKQRYKILDKRLAGDEIRDFGLISYLGIGDPPMRNIRHASALRSRNLDPVFTHPLGLFSLHSSLMDFKIFAEGLAASRDWKTSLNICVPDSIQNAILNNADVRRACVAYFKLMKSPDILERQYANELRALSQEIIKAAGWEIDLGSGCLDTTTGGHIAFPADHKTPAIKISSDFLATDSAGKRKVAAELKPRGPSSLDTSNFKVEAVTTHLGHLALATLCLAGDKFAMLWSRGTPEDLQLNLFPESSKLFQADKATLVTTLTLWLSLVASPRQQQNLEDEPGEWRNPLGSTAIVPVHASIEHSGHSDLEGDQATIPPLEYSNRSPVCDPLNLPQPSASASPGTEDDVWTEVNLRAKNGSFATITRLRDDLPKQIRHQILNSNY